MTRLAVEGIHLNVETVGDGPPLVLLHGFTGSAETWEPFMRPFGHTRRVLAVDLPGHGLSDSPPDPARYRTERCVDDLIALFDLLGIDRADLLGYSMGGRVALHLALSRTDRVGTVILESASPGIEGAEDRASRVQQDEALARLMEREGIEAFVDRWERLPLFASQERLDPSVRHSLRRQRLRGSAEGLAGSLRGLGAGTCEPLQHRLGDLQEVLLIAGALDEKYGLLAQEMGRAIPGATVRVVPDVGHAVHLERPDVFQDLVLRALTKRLSYVN